MVLEFGSGGSTVAIAQALYDNHRETPETPGFLCSIDDQAYWADVTRSIIPPGLNDVCEVLHVPTEEIEYDGIPCLRHLQLPEWVPDIIYLDGPTFTKRRKIAIDILEIESRFPPGFRLIIDGRDLNTAFLRHYLNRSYRFEYRALYNNTVVELIS